MLCSKRNDAEVGKEMQTEHYCYICVKRNGADKLCAENWEAVVEEIIRENQEELEDDEEGEEEEEDMYQLEKVLGYIKEEISDMKLDMRLDKLNKGVTEYGNLQMQMRANSGIGHRAGNGYGGYEHDLGGYGHGQGYGGVTEHRAKGFRFNVGGGGDERMELEGDGADVHDFEEEKTNL